MKWQWWTRPAAAVLLAMFMAVAIGPDPVHAAEAQESRTTGPVTGLPLPRFVSLKSGEGNARRGPGMTHRVDWVFRRRGMPLRVTAEFEHWRRVEDAEGLGGWMHHSLLSGVRTVLVVDDMTALRLQADERAPVTAWLEAGVVARVLSCGPEWCRLDAERLRGWAPRAALWGVDAAETLD